ncbi:TetR/AcrR family transcriptional regulator [Bacillus timonensis]|uniref:TetR/AcrR family transcriptional regulator n=1 Tax=Bacillus timonensis TaxID=1033734 RepID=A0A4V6RSW6_9BACI|nr:TetR family transcriptional regulator [Bacillus timonensis]THE13253.1 TetR/AcrR family transcriptional regulator [Bacillus timonensis]
MPKLTFFNLPEDKKQTLIDAAKKEFSSAPLFDASISNIIKSAGISRGSFYQYFEDKEDAFFFLLGEFAKEKKSAFLSMLKKYDGDIFQTFIDFFELFLKEDENLTFLKNALLNMTHKIELTFDRMISDHEINENFNMLCSRINISKMNVSDEVELFHAMQIITSVLLRNLIHAFAHDLPRDVAIENFMTEMNLLKKGLVR